MTRDEFLLMAAKADYAERYPARPWWWWLALVAYLGTMSGGFWIIYRAFAGWPMKSTGFLQWLAG